MNMKAQLRFPKREAPVLEKKEHSVKPPTIRKHTPRLAESSEAEEFLSAQDEWTLINRWRLKDDQSALASIVLAFQPLVKARAAKFPTLHDGVDGWDEAVSAGNLGLLEALNRFDPNLGYRLGSYAPQWIDAEIREIARGRSSVVKTPRGVAALADDPLGEEPSECAPLDNIRRNRKKQIASPELMLAHAQERRRYLTSLAAALAQLPGREQRIYWERNITERRVTFEELGRRFSISAERVRQIERKAASSIAIYLEKASAECASIPLVKPPAKP